MVIKMNKIKEIYNKLIGSKAVRTVFHISLFVLACLIIGSVSKLISVAWLILIVLIGIHSCTYAVHTILNSTLIKKLFDFDGDGTLGTVEKACLTGLACIVTAGIFYLCGCAYTMIGF